MMSLTDDAGTALTAAWDGRDLFRYVYQPDNPRAESPRPYFHPLATLGGDVVTIIRPHDHVWHKGLALSLPHVGPDNFWGGPTFRDGGYAQLPNNGVMRHVAFDEATAEGGRARVAERLTWVTEGGQEVITECRQFTATAWPASRAWGLTFATTLTNATGAAITFASPTTEGRPNAGYGGLFWRGPRSFTGGRVMLPDAMGGDELMGRRAPWLAFAGQHDEHGRWSTLVFADDPANAGHPSQWFVRSTPFAAVCPAPFFGATRALPAGARLSLRYGIAIADGDLDAAACAGLAARLRDLPHDERT
jgi:hypothetical protein